MHKAKTTFFLLTLFAILLFPAVPHAALEHAASFNLFSAAEVESLSQEIGLFSVYIGAMLMGVCALGIMLFCAWLVRQTIQQVREREYRAW